MSEDTDYQATIERLEGEKSQLLDVIAGVHDEHRLFGFGLNSVNKAVVTALLTAGRLDEEGATRKAGS